MSLTFEKNRINFVNVSLRCFPPALIFYRGKHIFGGIVFYRNTFLVDVYMNCVSFKFKYL